MTPTPTQQALWANQVQRDCLLEAGDDVESALAAAECILEMYPLPPTSLDAFLSHDIHNKHAQGILNRTLKEVKGFTSTAQSDLERALERGPVDSGHAIIEFIEKYRIQLARLLTTTQMASLLEGAREVANKVPVLKKDKGVIERSIGEIPPPAFPPPTVATGVGPERIHLVTIEEAAKSLAGKNVLTRHDYDALEAAARSKAFTVAGVDTADTLTKIRDVMAENVQKGADYATFRKEVMEAVEQGTFLSPAHMETVFRTNVQSAFSDGQMSVLQNPLVRSGFPYSAYDSIHDDRVRDEHFAMDSNGIGGSNIYRNDDPVFNTFRPPWDYNCRCSWTPITVRQAAARGIKEAQEWLDTGVEPYPPAHVSMPPWQPPEGFQRAISSAPMSVQLSLQPVSFFFGDFNTHGEVPIIGIEEHKRLFEHKGVHGRIPHGWRKTKIDKYVDATSDKGRGENTKEKSKTKSKGKGKGGKGKKSGKGKDSKVAEESKKDRSLFGRLRVKEYKLPDKIDLPLSIAEGSSPEVVAEPDIAIAGISATYEVKEENTAYRTNLKESGKDFDSKKREGDSKPKEPGTIKEANPDNLPEKLGVVHDWDRLRAVMVGTPDNDIVAEWSPDWEDPYADHKPGDLWLDAEPEKFKKSIEETNKLCELLTKEGIDVFRPPLTPIELAKAHPVGLSAQYARESFSVWGIDSSDGKTIMTLDQMRYASRNKEHIAINPFLDALVENKNAKFLKPPVPKNFDLDPHYDADQRCWLEGGDMFRIGKNILITVSYLASSPNGIKWLSEQLEPLGYKVHTGYLTHDFFHGDYMIHLIKEGLAIAHVAGFVDNKLPEPLTDWEVVEVTLDEANEKFVCNGICLRPNTYLMSEGCPRVRKALEKKGVDVIEIPFDNTNWFQGSIDCTTNELWRDE